MMTKLYSSCEQLVYASFKLGTARRVGDTVDNSYGLSTACGNNFSWGSRVIHGAPRSMKERMI